MKKKGKNKFKNMIHFIRSLNFQSRGLNETPNEAWDISYTS